MRQAWQPSAIVGYPRLDMAPPHPRVFEFCDVPPPFAPGQSPFHIKGQFYLQAMRALQRVGKPLEELLPQDLRAFCSQEFLASQWYDVLPFPRLAMIEAD